MSRGLPESTEVELVQDARATLGEGPVWDGRTQELVWVDILAGAVHRLDPSTGRDRVLTVGQPVGTVAVRLSGGYVAALRDGIAVLGDDGGLAFISDVEAELPTHRFNDGKCDRTGRLWAGTMRFDQAPGSATLYRVDPDHTVTPVVTGLGLSNGLGWSLDGSLMYFIDSLAGGVDVFDFDDGAGITGGPRRLVTFVPEEGLPDGMTVDADGFLWVALYGGGQVRRYSPEGELDLVVRLPVGRPTSCAFGGAELDELYITTARQGQSSRDLAAEPGSGGIFRFRPAVRGRPDNVFGG
jgi:sugar lactone lactonase YvrE